VPANCNNIVVDIVVFSLTIAASPHHPEAHLILQTIC
jgi:hypothetical protein